jgi:hypothetical protein
MLLLKTYMETAIEQEIARSESKHGKKQQQREETPGVHVPAGPPDF